MEKRGLLHNDISDKGVIKRGNKLEPIIADEFAEDKKVKVINPNRTFIPEDQKLASDHPWLGAHPDRVFESKNGKMWGLEIKTASREVYHRNINQGLDQGYLLQSVYYLYITGLAGWVLRMKNPDSWDDYDFIIRRDEGTKEIFNLILTQGDWFWGLVKSGEEPPAKAAPKLPKVADGEIKQTDSEEWNQVGQWLLEAQQAYSSAKETLDLAKKAVQLQMENNNWTAVDGPVLTPAGSSQLRAYCREQKGRITFKGKEAVALLDNLKKAVDEKNTDLIYNTLSSYNSLQFTKQGNPTKPLRMFWLKTNRIQGDK